MISIRQIGAATVAIIIGVLAIFDLTICGMPVWLSTVVGVILIPSLYFFAREFQYDRRRGDR